MTYKINKANTRFRLAVRPEFRVLVYLTFVGRGMDYRSIGEQFGIGKATVGDIVRQVSHALKYEFMHTIAFPSRQETLRSLEAGFRASGMPGAVGAVDGSHFEINFPADEGEAYVCRKGYPTLVGQFVAASDMRCLDAAVGYPGSYHDSRIWRESPLWSALQTGTVPLRHMDPTTAGGETIPSPGVAPVMDVFSASAPTLDDISMYASQSGAAGANGAGLFAPAALAAAQAQMTGQPGLAALLSNTSINQVTNLIKTVT